MASTAKVNALMKGEIHTDELMHIIVKKESGLRTSRRMSHVFVMDVSYYHKPLFLSDVQLLIFFLI